MPQNLRSETKPEVTIGLPVYNGERHLGAALDSLLGQTFSDFELILSDNSSIDSTEEICRAYASRDGRIRYFRQAQNFGAAHNWNFVLDQASGRYFKWASANDLCAPSYIERCVDALRLDPASVLAYTKAVIIDAEGRITGVYDDDPKINSERPSTRFVSVLQGLSLNNAQCGLIRLDALRRTRGERGYPGGDMVLMAELALQGRFQLIDERLFFRRIAPGTTMTYLSPAERRHFLQPQGLGVNFPTWRRSADYLWSVARSNIRFSEKTRAAIFTLRWIGWHRDKLLDESMGRDEVSESTT